MPPNMNWPPTTMATQHPDNASVPWWREDAFVPTQAEIDELLLLYRELPIDEYMWDWEGKYVDEAVGEKIYSQALEFFQDKPLGEELHLTFRIPAFEDGKMHRMARAFMNLLSLADLGAELGFQRAPVTEMFLPLTENAEQLKLTHKTFCDTITYHRSIFHGNQAPANEVLAQYAVTPLIEDIDSMFSIENILEPYWSGLKQDGQLDPERGRRIFLARSDPALNSGLIPAVLAVKAALSKADELGQNLGIDVHPVIGTGSLPFRGSVNPLYTDEFLKQYRGVRTYSIQSAFRYDYKREQVEETLQKIKAEAPGKDVQRVSDDDRAKLVQLAELFTAPWQQSIEAMADVINTVADYVPARRERKLHVGLFGYSRGVGLVTLPRAIKFTAAFYSLGVPPEIISTGRGLRAAKEQGFLPLIEAYYPALRGDLKHAGKFINRENLELLAEKYPAFAVVQEDIAGIEEVLEIDLVPEKPYHVVHRNLTSNIFHRLHPREEESIDAAAVTRDIVEAGVIRRSLG